MKVTNNYNNVIIESALSLKDIMDVKRYAPKNLQLRDAKGHITFGIMFGGDASVKDNGIIFNDVTGEGKIFVSVNIPGMASETAEQRKDVIKDLYGLALANLEKVEAQVTSALTEVNATVESINASITCM